MSKQLKYCTLKQKAPVSYLAFLNSSVERLYLIILESLFNRRLPRNKSEVIPE